MAALQLGRDSVRRAILPPGWMLAVCVMLTSAIAIGRQDPTPRFKTAVHAVEVDATVLDPAGRPVRGLGAPDFTVRENGEPRRIIGLREVVIPVAPQDAAPPPMLDVADNQAMEGRLLVLFIDDATIPLDPAMIQAAKDIAWGAVERMGPADLMSVVFTGHTSHAQDFTRDRERLRRAIDRTTVGFDLSGSDGGALRMWRASFLTLVNITQALRDVPRQRKAILFVSIGMPGGGGFVKEWRRISQESPGSQTPVYSFDPSGVGGLEAYNETHPASRVRASPNGLREVLQTISSNTGGRAAVLTNTYDSTLDQLFSDTASYYLVAYETPQPPDDGRLRRLEIRTTRSGAAVRARPFFFSPKLSSRASARRSSSSIAFDALASAIPVQDLPMRAMAAPFAGTGRDPATIAIVIALRHPTGRTREHRVDLVSGVFEHEGRQRAVQRQEATVRLADPLPEDAVYEVTTSIGVGPGRYRLRVGAYSRSLERSGSVFLDVDVPDFSKERLSLSGLVLGTSAAPKQAVVQGIRSILPIAASSVREFSRSETVTGFIRVYQGGAPGVRPVQVRIRVLDREGIKSTAVEWLLPPEQFSRMRAADVSFPVPVERAAPGPYTLQFEASTADGRTTTREVAFALR